MSVYGTVTCKLKLRGFSWKHFRSLRFRRTSMLCLEDLPTDLPVGLLHSQTGTSNTRMIFRTPSPHRTCTWCRNINLLPIDYASSLALGADSPCSDERRAGNLGLTASGLFTRFNVTHVSIRTSDTSSSPLEPPSQAYRTLPYHLHLSCKSALSVIDLAPLHLPRMRTRSVSYYAFFEGWLLLSQLPDCLSLHTSFST